MSRQKQPSPITEGWAAYRKLVDEEIEKEKKKGEIHVMVTYPNIKCLTHEDCHMDSFYPGKIYRAMEMERDEDGFLKLKK